MPKLHMTAIAVERIKTPKQGQTDYFDTIMPGLLLRVGYGGTKAWRVVYYVRSKPRYLGLGRYPLISLREARDKAREVLKFVAEGGDPKAKDTRSPVTVNDLFDQFLERYMKPKNRSWKESARQIRKEALSRWGDNLAAEVTRHDILTMTDEIIDRGAPYVANQAFAAVRKMFNWAVQRGIIEHSPVAGLSRPANEQSRDHVVEDEELITLWNAWGTLAWPWKQYFQVLLLTAQRRGEVAHMRWDHLNLKNATWSLPRELTKAKRAHEVPLSDTALEIIEAMPRFDGPFVFSTTGGELPIAAFTRAKLEADKAAKELVENQDFEKVLPWRVHDLRRTAATGMARLGIPPHILSSILNHAPSGHMGVTAIYARHEYTKEKRSALQAWANHLNALFNGQGDNVVPLHATNASNSR